MKGEAKTSAVEMENQTMAVKLINDLSTED
jgi:hypothetical protein